LIFEEACIALSSSGVALLDPQDARIGAAHTILGNDIKQRFGYKTLHRSDHVNRCKPFIR